jgi:hypothetical protein
MHKWKEVKLKKERKMIESKIQIKVKFVVVRMKGENTEYFVFG